MLKTKNVLLGWLLAASLALVGGIAMATMSPGEVVTGTITAINGTMINIQGQIYTIAAGSPAHAAVETLKPGQVVDVQQDGPAKSTSWHVIYITLHSGD